MSNKHPAEIVMELDPNLSPADEGFRVAMFLVATAQVGPNIQKIKEAVGMPLNKAREYMQRCRANGIVKSGKIHSDWFGENGMISFWLDVATVQGLIRRIHQESPHADT